MENHVQVYGKSLDSVNPGNSFQEHSKPSEVTDSVVVKSPDTTIISAKLPNPSSFTFIPEDVADHPIEKIEIDLDSELIVWTGPTLLSNDCPIVIEKFSDGWFLVYFKDFPSIVADSDGGNLKDALDNLADVVFEDFKIMDEYGNNVSEHLKKQHLFLKRVFKI